MFAFRIGRARFSRQKQTTRKEQSMALGLRRRLAAAGVVALVALVGAGTAAACGDRGGDHAVHSARSAAFAPSHHHHAWHHRGLLAVPAAYLGLTKAQLRDRLASGKTLAQVADATPGKSAAGLVDYVVGLAKAKLDPWVARGKLTADRESAILAKLRDWATAAVSRTWTHATR
jgi:hypothetical protein